jgi:DNA-directed RNA polymerase specialized sigma24 family protein
MPYNIQIDNEVREATAEEAAVIDAQKAAAVKAEADKLAKEQARAAVLAKLGLTADEAAALFG